MPHGFVMTYVIDCEIRANNHENGDKLKEMVHSINFAGESFFGLISLYSFNSIKGRGIFGNDGS